MYKVPVMQMYNFLGGPKYGMRTIVKNTISYGFSGGSDGKESACNAGDLGLTLGREDLLEKGWLPTLASILAWRIAWREELVGYSPWGRKELDMTQ